MRLRAARAGAALLLLALVAGACKPSSLTPFGIDRREPDQPGINGQWSGTTASGGDVTFLVASDTVLNITLVHRESGCLRTFTTAGDGDRVSNGSFRHEGMIDPAGRLVIEGSFAGPDAASGRYFFEGLAFAPPCPTSSAGTFTAVKEP